MTERGLNLSIPNLYSVALRFPFINNSLNRVTSSGYRIQAYAIRQFTGYLIIPLSFVELTNVGVAADQWIIMRGDSPRVDPEICVTPLSNSQNRCHLPTYREGHGYMYYDICEARQLIVGVWTTD